MSEGTEKVLRTQQDDSPEETSMNDNQMAPSFIRPSSSQNLSENLYYEEGELGH